MILPLTKIEFTRSKLKGPLHQGGSRILGNFGIILAGKCALNFAKLLLWLPKRMIMFPGRRIRAAFLLLGAVVFLMTVALAVAHAVLLESSPAPKSSVNGPDVPLRLRFNVRIDAARSRLTRRQKDYIPELTAFAGRCLLPTVTLHAARSRLQSWNPDATPWPASSKFLAFSPFCFAAPH